MRLALSILLVGILMPQPRPRAAGDDPHDLDGTWVIASAELGGEPLPPDALKDAKLTIRDKEYAFVANGQEDKGVVKYDASKTPHEIDITGTEGPNKGKTILAIYDLKDDSLKICYEIGDGPRPQQFKSAPKSTHFLVVYQRQK